MNTKRVLEEVSTLSKLAHRERLTIRKLKKVKERSLDDGYSNPLFFLNDLIGQSITSIRTIEKENYRKLRELKEEVENTVNF
jgi:hypothetical protein